MRICRLETGVLILVVSMCGCSQTSLLPRAWRQSENDRVCRRQAITGANRTLG